MPYIIPIMSLVHFLKFSHVGQWLTCRKDLSNKSGENSSLFECTVIRCKLYYIRSVKQRNCYINHSRLFPFQMTLLQQSSSLSKRNPFAAQLAILRTVENLRPAKLKPASASQLRETNVFKYQELGGQIFDMKGFGNKSPKSRCPFLTLSPNSVPKLLLL